MIYIFDTTEGEEKARIYDYKKSKSIVLIVTKYVIYLVAHFAKYNKMNLNIEKCIISTRN